MTLSLETMFGDGEIERTIGIAGERAGLRSRGQGEEPYLLAIEHAAPGAAERAQAAMADPACREIWATGVGEAAGVWSSWRRAGRIEWLSLPTTLRDWIARFENARRRNAAGARIELPGGLPYEPRARRVGRGEGGCELTEKEAALLEALLAAGEDGLDRARLLELVWRYAPGIETHTLETHVYRLRQKLDPLPGSPAVQADQGGYRLVVRPPGT